MRANQLVKHNIQTLLRVRHEHQRDLAQHCYKSESWISKIFKETRREFSFKDLDRIAEFFGIAVYQLLQPGISSLTERRSSIERRSAKERRIGHTARFMMETAMEIDANHPRRKGGPHAIGSSPHRESIRRLVADFEKRIAALLPPPAQPGDETPTPRRKVAGAPLRRGATRGPDAQKD